MYIWYISPKTGVFRPRCFVFVFAFFVCFVSICSLSLCAYLRTCARCLQNRIVVPSSKMYHKRVFVVRACTARHTFVRINLRLSASLPCSRAYTRALVRAYAYITTRCFFFFFSQYLMRSYVWVRVFIDFLAVSYLLAINLKYPLLNRGTHSLLYNMYSYSRTYQ